jgi:hypothetical protein
MSASRVQEAGALGRCTGNSAVAQSISSMASSGSLPSGSATRAAFFKSVRSSPFRSLAFSSSAVKLTIFFDFLPRRSPHRNNIPGLAAPKPDDRVKFPLHLYRALPSVLVISRRRLMNNRATVEEPSGPNKIETTICDRCESLVFILGEFHTYSRPDAGAIIATMWSASADRTLDAIEERRRQSARFPSSGGRATR